ncbi:MAG: hypothetical protein LBE50_01840 [Gallionellaceae bacterium]|jgi:hypothetical protein|nr:hypothetical protein [Gallionellaceae bacterium]
MASTPTSAIVSIQKVEAAPRPAAAARDNNALTLDLDERAVLYPAGKGITRITLSPERGGIAFDAAFAFNESRTPPRILWLSLDDARVFGRSLVDSVYQARPQNAITESMRIGITVHTNGFHIDIAGEDHPVELFVGLNSIWRFALLILRAVDRLSPVEAH